MTHTCNPSTQYGGDHRVRNSTECELSLGYIRLRLKNKQRNRWHWLTDVFKRKGDLQGQHRKSVAGMKLHSTVISVTGASCFLYLPPLAPNISFYLTASKNTMCQPDDVTFSFVSPLLDARKWSRETFHL